MNPDINTNSVNELERFALDEVARRLRFDNEVSALDYPCGDGSFAARLASQGARVVACDLATQAQSVKGRSLSQGVGDAVRFVPMTQPTDEALPEGPFDLVVCRQGIAHLPYAQAKLLIRRLLKTLNIGGKLFVFTYGLHSELGDAYPAAQSLVEDRFAELEGPVAERYGITGPLCLYTERNLITLMFEAGGSVLRSFTTTHGSVATIAVKV